MYACLLIGGARRRTPPFELRDRHDATPCANTVKGDNAWLSVTQLRDATSVVKLKFTAACIGVVPLCPHQWRTQASIAV